MMRRKLSLALVMLVASGWPTTPAARAAVVVLANRTEETVRFTFTPATEKARDGSLRPREVLTIPTTGNVRLDLPTADKPRQHELRPNEIYCILPRGRQLEVRQVGLTGVWGRPAPSAGKEATPKGPDDKAARFPVKVPVKILVDQKEPMAQKAWEKRLRERIEAASEVLEPICRVRFEVVAAGTWESDDSLTSLAELLRDFQRKAPARPARLAIGFTGRVAPRGGDKALGATTIPLHTHIIIREWKPRTEAERLEVLVHELGHFLGAGHSPEMDSVMRPKLGDGRVNLRSFRIGFDPINTLALNVVAEELARKPALHFGQLSAESQKRLTGVYATLARADPDDPAAPRYLRLLGGTPPEPMTTRKLPDQTVAGARAVARAIAAAAAQNNRLPAAKPGESAEGRRRTGDALTAHYVQVAAAASRKLPTEHAATAFLLGLAVAVDREGTLRSLNLAGIPWDKLESDAERFGRLQVLGEPTLRGRAALLQHFLATAALVVLLEGQAVSAAGVQEELLQIQGGKEFRFDDLCAGLAGILFGTQLDASPALLDELARSFHTTDFLLDPRELSEPISRNEFSHEYGSTTDERFLKQQDILRKRLLALPGYQPRPPRSER